MDEGDVGGGGDFYVAECVVVLSREEDEGDDLTSSTAYTAAMCSLLCMDNVTSNPLHQVEYSKTIKNIVLQPHLG